MNASDAIVNRYACKSFKSDAVLEEKELRHVLALTQRAPTCFNSQPWVAVIARRGTLESQKLVDASFTGNQQRIRDASATILFCADTEPTRNLDKMADLFAALGYDRNVALSKFSLPIKMIGSHSWPSRWVFGILKTFLLPVIGLFKPVMTAMLGESTRTWAIKQTMAPATTFMIAATARGLATSPMEGFDAARARAAVGLPRRFVPAVMISVGTAAGPAPSGGSKQSLRFDPTQVYFDGTYNKPFEGIEPAVKKDKTS